MEQAETQEPRSSDEAASELANEDPAPSTQDDEQVVTSGETEAADLADVEQCQAPGELSKEDSNHPATRPCTPASSILSQFSRPGTSSSRISVSSQSSTRELKRWLEGHALGHLKDGLQEFGVRNVRDLAKVSSEKLELLGTRPEWQSEDVLGLAEQLRIMREVKEPASILKSSSKPSLKTRNNDAPSSRPGTAPVDNNTPLGELIQRPGTGGSRPSTSASFRHQLRIRTAPKPGQGAVSGAKNGRDDAGCATVKQVRFHPRLHSALGSPTPTPASANPEQLHANLRAKAAARERKRAEKEERRQEKQEKLWMRRCQQLLGGPGSAGGGVAGPRDALGVAPVLAGPFKGLAQSANSFHARAPLHPGMPGGVLKG